MSVHLYTPKCCTYNNDILNEKATNWTNVRLLWAYLINCFRAPFFEHIFESQGKMHKIKSRETFDYSSMEGKIKKMGFVYLVVGWVEFHQSGFLFYAFELSL